MTRQLVLGTAGHIDHGKTELVRALTGVDTDRLPEEQRRGITIDLGFARMTGGPGVELAIVDVPGHEGFIRNMVAGASGMDMALVVVAADEGVMPQTREHVAIVRLLGVRELVVALTKTDLVDADWLELAREDVRSFLDHAGFGDAPVHAVSARSGEGVDELRAAIQAAAARAPARAVDDLFRLPVDRVFSVKGTGTVVTGTVWSGRLATDTNVRLLPSGLDARVRALQRHGEAVAEVAAGHRAAVALAGVDRHAIGRGETLVDHRSWDIAHMLTARLTAVPDVPRPIEARQRVRFHLGTAEVMGRVTVLDGIRLEPGQTGWVQLRLEKPVVARAGDPFVIRSYSPVTTIGGGRVVEPAPPKRRGIDADEARYLGTLADGSLEEAVAQRIRRAGLDGVQRQRLPLDVAGTARAVEAAMTEVAPVLVGELVVDAAAFATASEELLAAVAAYHEAQPLRPGMDRQALRDRAPRGPDPVVIDAALDALLEDGRLVAGGGVVALPMFRVQLSEGQQRLQEALLEAYEAAGLEPPTAAELPDGVRDHPDRDAVLALLQEEGRLVPVSEELTFHRSVLDRAAERLVARLGGHSELSPADFREVLGVSRKYLIPLLEHMDGRGVTRRSREGRSVPVPGRSP